MKNILIILSLLSLSFYKSQVGINTPSPEKNLDVNGSLNVRKELRNGGTSTTKGNAGTADQFFSVNNSSSDLWKTIQIANGTGSLSLFYLHTVVDKVGISSTASGGTGVYVLDENNGNATFITDLKDEFSITKTDNKSKAVLSLQTTVQISRTTGDGSASFACGLFLQKNNEVEQLKAVRNDAVRGASGTYKIFNLNVTLDGLGAGSYKVRTGCYFRNLSTGTTLAIGKPALTSNLNSEMAQSVLTTSVLQTY